MRPRFRQVQGRFLMSWSLNNAELSVDSRQAVVEKADQALPFEVVAYAKITLTIPQGRDGYTGRSHSLWYCDAQDLGVFRWYETAFWDRKTYGLDNRLVPFAMSPEGRDTALALSNGWHTHNVARPFMLIDQGDEESFVERWMKWFAQAAQGQLHCPSQMPEIEPTRFLEARTLTRGSDPSDVPQTGVYGTVSGQGWGMPCPNRARASTSLVGVGVAEPSGVGVGVAVAVTAAPGSRMISSVDTHPVRTWSIASASTWMRAPPSKCRVNRFRKPPQLHWRVLSELASNSLRVCQRAEPGWVPPGKGPAIQVAV